MRIEPGHCFCGRIQALMHGEPFWICYDHDDDCRRAIGSPLTIWVGYRPEQFVLKSGYLKTFSKTPGIVRTFCGDCGTSIGYEDQGLPDNSTSASVSCTRQNVFRPKLMAFGKCVCHSLLCRILCRAPRVYPTPHSRVWHAQGSNAINLRLRRGGKGGTNQWASP